MAQKDVGCPYMRGPAKQGELHEDTFAAGSLELIGCLAVPAHRRPHFPPCILQYLCGWTTVNQMISRSVIELWKIKSLLSFD